MQDAQFKLGVLYTDDMAIERELTRKKDLSKQRWDEWNYQRTWNNFKRSRQEKNKTIENEFL